MSLGITEILLIVGIALLFFGPTRLPAMGKGLGEAIRGFKKGMKDTGDQPSDREQLKGQEDGLKADKIKSRDRVES